MNHLTKLLKEITIQKIGRPFTITPEPAVFKPSSDTDTLTTYLNKNKIRIEDIDKYKLIQYKENCSIITNIKIDFKNDIWDKLNTKKNINDGEVYKKYVVDPAISSLQSAFDKNAGPHRIKVYVDLSKGRYSLKVRLIIAKDSPDNFKMKV